MEIGDAGFFSEGAGAEKCDVVVERRGVVGELGEDEARGMGGELFFDFAQQHRAQAAVAMRARDGCEVKAAGSRRPGVFAVHRERGKDTIQLGYEPSCLDARSEGRTFHHARQSIGVPWRAHGIAQQSQCRTEVSLAEWTKGRGWHGGGAGALIGSYVPASAPRHG